MIGLIILISLVGSVILSYKLGSIYGYRKGYEECDAISQKTFGEAVKNLNKEKQDGK